MSLYFSKGEIPLQRNQSRRGLVLEFTFGIFPPRIRTMHIFSEKKTHPIFCHLFFSPSVTNMVFDGKWGFDVWNDNMTPFFVLVTLLTWELPLGRWLIIGKLWLQNYSRGAVTVQTKNWFNSQRVEITIREILAFHLPWLGTLIIHHHGSASNS